jgi:hypothetical protein
MADELLNKFAPIVNQVMGKDARDETRKQFVDYTRSLLQSIGLKGDEDVRKEQIIECMKTFGDNKDAITADWLESEEAEKELSKLLLHGIDDEGRKVL